MGRNHPMDVRPYYRMDYRVGDWHFVALYNRGVWAVV